MKRKRSSFGSASIRLLLLVGMMLTGLSTLVFSFSGTALAATDTVTTCDESHLASAINGSSAGDVINFSCSGTITLTSALPDITHDVTLDGSGYNVTIDGASTYHLLDITGSTTSVTVKNLTFAHGSNNNGGAIIDNSSSGTLTLTGDTFSHNTATGNSGGAVTFEGTGTFIVTNSIFSNNSGDGYGGAICDIGGDLTVTGSTFSSNTAPSQGEGGAIYYSGGATLTVNGSTFSNNSATNYGGAIYDGNSSNATIGSGGAGNGNTFTDNTAGYNGGAIYNNGNIVVTIDYNTFMSNSTTATDGDTYGGAIDNNVNGGDGTTAQNVEYDAFTSNIATAASTHNAGGGAIYNEGSTAYLNIHGSTFTTNAATVTGSGVADGGAIANDSSNTAGQGGVSLELVNSTLTSNTAASDGGALYGDSNSSPLLLTGDTFSHNTAANSAGGAITDYSSGVLTVTNSAFSTNSAAGEGGAIYVGYSDLIVTNSTFSSNTATGAGQGGAIFYDGGNTLTVNGSTFTSNAAVNSGGALYDNSSSTVTIGSSGTGNGNTFTSNTAVYDGGAIYNADNSVVNINYNTFTSNAVTGSTGDSYGGAIANNVTDGGGTTFQYLDYNTFTSNMATAASTHSSHGGAIYNTGSDAYLYIYGSTFSGNSASVSGSGQAYGGALYNDSSNSPPDEASLVLANSTLTGNTATDGGGAIYNDSQGETDIYSSTIARNSITPANSLGAGIYNDHNTGSVYVGGSIVANNMPDNCHIPSGVPVTDNSYNLESGTDCNFSVANHSLQNTNPQLAASLANNGGLTQTLALLDGSPAINQIPLTGEYDCTYYTNNLDQRGIVRPQGPACDIGAFEFQAPSVSVPFNPVTGNATTSTQTTVTYTATASDLDNPSSAPTLVCMKEPGNIVVPTGTGASALFSIGTTTVSCTATDKATPPDVTRRIFHVIVTDNINPTLTVPTGNSDPVKVNATGTSHAPGNVKATSTSHTPANVKVSHGSIPVNIPIASVTLSDYISASDPIYPASQLTITCIGSANTYAQPNDGAHFAPGQTETFYNGLTTVVCYATNPVGKQSVSKTFHIDVVDTPSIAFQSGYSDPLTVATTDGNGGNLTLTHYLHSADPITCTASDVNGGSSFLASSAYTFPIGTRSVSCKASNGTVTTNALVFSLTVSPIALTTPFLVSTAANYSEGASLTYTAQATADYASGSPSYSLNCWYGTPPDVIYVATGINAHQTFPIGTTTVTCTADDALGNTVTQTFKAVVTDYPSLTVPSGNDSPVTVYATSEQGASVDLSQSVSSTDEFLPHASISCWLDSDKTQSNIYPEYTFPINGSSLTAPATTVDCQATNSAGFTSATKSFAVQVVDLLGPSVSVPSHTVTVNANWVVKGAILTLSNSVSASDPIYEQAHLTIHCTLPSGTNNLYPAAYTFPIGNTTVTCHAVNPLGAESSDASFTVSVKDPYNPTMQLPKTITVTTTNVHGTKVGFHIVVADVIYATNKLTLTCTHWTGTMFGVGTTTLQCSVRNPAGNMTTGTFKIVVKYIHK